MAPCHRARIELEILGALQEEIERSPSGCGVPSLGGTFWFFHAPLTDVDYVLTVTDQLKHVTRTYASSRSASGELCGAADTSAFLP